MSRGIQLEDKLGVGSALSEVRTGCNATQRRGIYLRAKEEGSRSNLSREDDMPKLEGGLGAHQVEGAEIQR